jgi:hypothetical protein
MSVFNGERASRILLDAMLYGDASAAAKWKVSERTVRNHRARLDTDGDFAALFLKRKTAADSDWRVVRLHFLRKSIAKLEVLVVAASTPASIRDVAEAIRVIGELQLASDVLGEEPRAGDANARPGGPAGTPPSIDDDGDDAESVH